MISYVGTIKGVPADVYQAIMQAERRGLYMNPAQVETVFQEYLTGLFSPGRPGLLVHELDDVYRAKDQKIVSHVIGVTPSENLFEYVEETVAYA